jgi:hypothetical protein
MAIQSSSPPPTPSNAHVEGSGTPTAFRFIGIRFDSRSIVRGPLWTQRAD